MAKQELGTKRVCPATGRKFYDLNKDPIISPYTGEAFPRAMFEPQVKGGRPQPDTAKATEEADTDEIEDVEVISLEEADDEASGGKRADPVAGDDDIEIEDDIVDDDDDTFLADDEDADDDVVGLIDGDIEDDEET